MVRGMQEAEGYLLPRRAEYLEEGCFSKTGLESVEFPASLRIISQGSFSLCESLKTARFADGLEVLGTDECVSNGGAFQCSVLESVRLPSTLKRIECSTFAGC